MTTAVAVCALCGGGLHAARCPQCGHRTEPGWPTPTWSNRAEPASLSVSLGGLAIDVALVVALGALTVLAARTAQLHSTAVWVLGAAAGLGVAGWVTHRYRTRGRALGHRILTARALVPSSGLPAGRWGQLRRVRFFSTRHHDPLGTSGTVAAGQTHEPGPIALRPPLPTVILPDGRAAAVGARTIIGRYPVPQEPGATTVAINDLSRSMSRAHVALEADGAGQVVAIDLNSANGTAVVVGKQTATLKPQARVPVPLPCVLRCGSQMINLVDAGIAPTLRAESPGWTPSHVPSGWLPS